MTADPKRHTDDPADWRGDFASAEESLLDASLAVTPAERLKWLEEAIAFAYKMGALPKRDGED
jgi:hypothetical protein